MSLAIAPVAPGGWLAVAAAMLLLTGFPLTLFLRGLRRREYPSALVRLLVYRPFWYTQLLVLIAGMAGGSGLVVGALFGAPLVVARGAIIGAALIYAVALVAGWIGSRWLNVRELTATFPDLPASFEGLRIVQISDLHIGPQTSRHFLRRVRDAVKAARGDLIAVTGDLVDDHAADAAHYVSSLGDLSAPLGVYIVPGNHDVYAGWPAVRAALERLRVRVLVNAAHVAERQGGRVAIVGTGDPAGQWSKASGAAPNIDAALHGVPPGTFTIALAHNPALWPVLAERSVRLTLSGHTHWGQLALPSLNWSLAGVFLDHAMGVVHRGESVLYIHPGTGFWGIPFRLGARPEVTIIELRRGRRAALGPLRETIEA